MLRDSRITCVAPRFSRSRVVGSRRQPPVGFILDRLYPLFGPRGPFQSGLLPFLTAGAVSDSVQSRAATPHPGEAGLRQSRRGATCLGIDRKPPPCRVGGLGSRLRGQSVSPPSPGTGASERVRPGVLTSQRPRRPASARRAPGFAHEGGGLLDCHVRGVSPQPCDMKAIDERYGGKCVLHGSGYYCLKLPGFRRDELRVILELPAVESGHAVDE